MVTQTVTCYHCGSTDLIRFGYQNNRQRYKCRRCGKTSRENKGSNAYDPTRKAEILAAYHERGSLRAMTRIFGVSRNTVLAWLKKAARLPPLKKTLVRANKDDILELDELWSFVQCKQNKRWVWLAQCRRTRQIVAYAIGDRSEKTCALLWKRVPKPYKKALLYTDFWKAYQKVLPQKRHRPTGKGEGQTCHIERFNNILRQRMSRLVRCTLSFSKTDPMHDNCLRLFLHDYNRQKATTRIGTLPLFAGLHRLPFGLDLFERHGLGRLGGGRRGRP